VFFICRTHIRYKEKLAEYNKASRVGNIEEMADIQKSLSEKEQRLFIPLSYVYSDPDHPLHEDLHNPISCPKVPKFISSLGNTIAKGIEKLQECFKNNRNDSSSTIVSIKQAPSGTTTQIK
jgi:hypothetical protein